jgi:hypothetical protein
MGSFVVPEPLSPARDVPVSLSGVIVEANEVCIGQFPRNLGCCFERVYANIAPKPDKITRTSLEIAEIVRDHDAQDERATIGIVL